MDAGRQTRRFHDDLLPRTRYAPGVRSAALVSSVPMAGFDTMIDILTEGSELPAGEEAPPGLGGYVSDGYFRTMGNPILAGRGFLESDREKAPLVAVVNGQAAKHFWPKGDAIGKRFRPQSAQEDLVRIVGIAKQAKCLWIADPLAFVYLPAVPAAPAFHAGAGGRILLPLGLHLTAV